MRVPKFLSVVFISVVFLFSSCWNSGSVEQPVAQGPSARKQKQRMHLLEKKLEIAQKEQRKVESEMEQLVSELDAVKLSLIRRQLDDYERKGGKALELFL